MCARSVMIVGRAAARQRSHDAEVSRPDGQRRQRQTSDACEVRPQFRVVHEARDDRPAAEAERCRLGADVVVVDRVADEQQPQTGHLPGERHDGAQHRRDALLGRDVAERGEHERVGRDARGVP